jgi:hypothetical protein
LCGDHDDFQIVYSYVEKDLTEDALYQVMLIQGLNGWSRMTRRARDAILRRVREGAGLVLIRPFIGDVRGHPSWEVTGTTAEARLSLKPGL